MTDKPAITAIAPSCEGCGVCCMHMAVPPYDDEEEELLRDNLPEVYADFLAVMETRKLQLAATGVELVPCAFLDPITRKCRHHEHSPDVCYRFKIAGQFCRNQRREAGLSIHPEPFFEEL